MIKIFRQLRISSITNNKIGKYLLYALGEIILVVIGILIALSINNWNEEKKLQKKEIQYLKEVKSNLVQDALRMAEVISAHSTKIEYMTETFKLMDVTYSQAERIAAIDIPRIAAFELFIHNNTAYNNLLNATSIDIIRNNHLKEQLSSYYTYDWQYAGNAKITERTRKLVDYLAERGVTKEAIQQYFGVETNLPNMKDYRYNEDPNFVSLYLSLPAVMGENIAIIENFKVKNNDLQMAIEEYLRDQ